jgi:sugar lactone lactonase YvrE
MSRRNSFIHSLGAVFVLILAGLLMGNANLERIGLTSRGWANASDLILYTDALTAGWQDWSWGTTRVFTNAAPVQSGTASIAVTYTAAWGGLSLRAPAPIDTATYSAVGFWAYGGAGGTSISLYAQSTDNGNALTAKSLTAPAGTWIQFTVPLSELGNPAQIARITWQDGSGGAQPTYYLDNIRLVAKTGGGHAFPDTTPDRSLTFQTGTTGVAVAPSGRLYVAAWRENRVYSWPNAAAVKSGDAPDLTFGGVNTNHNNETGCSFTPSAANLCGPESVAVDSVNNLYVADTYHHRVLIFRNPDTDASPTTADVVLGQGGNFGTKQTNFDGAANDGIVEGLYYPRGLAVDGSGNLWVVDEFNHRVLKFLQPLVGDALPDLVLGQSGLGVTVGQNFSGETAANRFNLPLGVVVDSAGTVYVTDYGNNRIARFDAPAANGPTATFISGFDHAHDLAVDAQDNLFVADTFANAVRIVLAGTTQIAPNPTYTSQLDKPMGLSLDAAGNLYVANCGDYPCENSTVLTIFDAQVESSTATPTVTSTSTGTATATPTTTPTSPASNADVSLSVDVAADRRPISEHIYGIHYVEDEAFAQEISLPVRRWGGNSTTRYNWKNQMFGNPDWYFENERMASSADDFIAKNKRTGAASIITIPMSGWMAKDPGQVGDTATYPCSFDTRKYNYTPLPRPNGLPARDMDDPKRSHCGSGIVKYENGEAIYFANNDPTDTSFEIGPAWTSEWIAHLTQTFGAAANGGVKFYGLDNEPDLWHETHRDVFPPVLTYDEIRRDAYAYAAAIKAADPTARTLGPVLMGWTYYWHSPRDGQSKLWTTRPDRMAHGDVPLVPWYLQQMKAYEDQHGVRLLDYLDLHFYPQNGVDLRDAGNAALQALRLRSTRALWDPSYVDESWIAQAGPDGGIVRLIPRMRDWVDQNYPGTKLAITEYNWGALDHINGALTQADILGIFGREGMDLATLFDTPYGNGGNFTPDSPAGYTFRIYRNYDGNGAKFGDVSVRAISTDQEKLSIYAAERNGDDALTLVVINKTGDALTANLSIANRQPPDANVAQIYRYSAANLNAIVKGSDQSLTFNGFTATFAANSITLIVVPQGEDGPSDPQHRLYLPALVR